MISVLLDSKGIFQVITRAVPDVQVMSVLNDEMSSLSFDA